MKYGWGAITVRKDGTAYIVMWDGNQEEIEMYYKNTREDSLRDIQLMYSRNSVWRGHWGRGKYYIYID